MENHAKEIMKELLNKQLNEFFSNPTNITVNMKEDELDFFEEFEESADNETIITQEEIDEFNAVNKPSNLVTVSYDYNTSYVGFHYFAWKELTTFQKAVTVYWFNELMCEVNNTNIYSAINTEQDKLIEYAYDKDEDKYYIVYNPLYERAGQFMGSFVMASIVSIHLKNQLDIAVKNKKQGITNSQFDDLTLANYMNPIKRPDCYDSFIYNEALTEAEEKKVLLYAYQPFEMFSKKVYDIINEYFEISENITQVYDTLFQEDRANNEENKENLEKLYKKHYANLDIKKQYEKVYKKELNYLSSLSENSQNQK